LGTIKTIQITESSFLMGNLTLEPNVVFAGTISAFGEGNYLAAVIVQAVKPQVGGG
jgi:hypothetical protein